MRKINIILWSLILLLFLGQSVLSQTRLKRSSFGIGGTMTQSNELKIVGTVGQPLIGKNTNQTFVNESGFLASAKMVLVSEDLFEAVPAKFELFQNYPNPFNPLTSIRFGIPRATHVKLDVYNILGQRVAILIDSKMEPGYQVIKFDGANLASGFYIYRFQAGDFIKFKKMILIE